MKKYTLVTLVILSLAGFALANSLTDREAVEAVSMGYIDGFYEGDADKLSKSIDTELYKFGFWKNKETGEYKHAGVMNYEAALKLAKEFKEKGRIAKPDAPKKVEVIEVSDKIAITKVYAYWGIDYMLLAKNDGKWTIRQILWEGPTHEANPTDADKKAVKNAGLGYIEGFYEGDESKLRNSLKPDMFKYGYSFDREAKKYKAGKRMTYEKAIAYTKWVRDKNKYAKADAVKKVEVLDVMNKTAALKVTATWGIDYMLLTKDGDKWMIDQVLWQGAKSKKS